MGSAQTLEICVDSVQGLDVAVDGGADRVELCSALALGGLTPGAGLIAAALARSLPCHAMIRPRAGDFVLRDGELDAMLQDIAFARAAGLAGIVIGAAGPDGVLDRAALVALVDAAGTMDVTLHRVFDLTPDPFAAMDVAIDLGITRILTSGQAAVAPDGVVMLRRLVIHAAGRVEIMAGGGVTPKAAAALLETGVDALHASCGLIDPSATDCALIGIDPARVTDARTLTALRAAMDKQEVPA